MDCTAQHVIRGALDRPSGSTSSGLLFFLLGCCAATACLVAVAVAVALTFVRQQRHRRGLLAAAELASADDARLRELLGEALPSW